MGRSADRPKDWRDRREEEARNYLKNRGEAIDKQNAEPRIEPVQAPAETSALYCPNGWQLEWERPDVAALDDCNKSLTDAERKNGVGCYGPGIPNRQFCYPKGSD
jgi:hypothetical protein